MNKINNDYWVMKLKCDVELESETWKSSKTP